MRMLRAEPEASFLRAKEKGSETIWFLTPNIFIITRENPVVKRFLAVSMFIFRALKRLDFRVS